MPFRDLTSTPDGTALYFSSDLIETGKTQSGRNKIYRISEAGLELIIDVPNADPSDPDHYKDRRGVTAPVLNTLGWLVGWTTMDVCGGSLNFVCAFEISSRIRNVFDGRVLGEQQTAAPLAPLYSPARTFALLRLYLGLGEYRYQAQSTAAGDPSSNQGLTTRGGVVAAVSDTGTLFAIAEGKLNVTAPTVANRVPPIDLPDASWGLISPPTQEFFVGRLTGAENATVIDAYSVVDGKIGKRTVARLPNLSCPTAQAATNGDLVLGCNDRTSFWRLSAAGELQSIPTGVQVPLGWTLAADGDVLWFADAMNRIFQYKISTGDLRMRLGSTPLLLPTQQTLAGPGTLIEVVGTGFSPSRLPAATAGGRSLTVSYATSMLAYVLAPLDGSCVLLRMATQASAPFGTPPITVQICPAKDPVTSFPYFFQSGQPSWTGTAPLVANSDFSAVVLPESPARAGAIVNLFLGNLGRTSPAVPLGQPTPSVGLFPVEAPLTCAYNALANGLYQQFPVDVLYAGLAPGLTGVYQVVVRLPNPAPSMPLTVSCTQYGFGNGATIAVVSVAPDR